MSYSLPYLGKQRGRAVRTGSGIAIRNPDFKSRPNCLLDVFSVVRPEFNSSRSRFLNCQLRLNSYSRPFSYLFQMQLNLSTTVTLGKKESCHCREVAVVERLKQERMMYGLSAKKNGRCAEVAVSGGSNVRICFCPNCG